MAAALPASWEAVLTPSWDRRLTEEELDTAGSDDGSGVFFAPGGFAEMNETFAAPSRSFGLREASAFGETFATFSCPKAEGCSDTTATTAVQGSAEAALPTPPAPGALPPPCHSTPLTALGPSLDAVWAAVNLADTEVQAPNMALAASAVPAKVTGTKPKLPPRPRAVVGQQDPTFARPRAPALGKAALSSRLPRGGGAAISPIDLKAMESPSPAETTRDLEGANVTRSLDNSETEPLEKTQSMNKTRPVDNTKVNETLPVNKTSCVNKTKSMNDSKSLNSTSTHSSSKVPRMKLTRSGAAEKPGNASRKPKLQSCNATVTKPSQDKTSTLISKPGRTSLTSNSSDQSSNTSAKKSLKTSQLRVNIYKNTSQARTGKSLKTSTSNPLETSKPQETSQSTKTSQPIKTSQPTKTSQHTKTSQSTKTSQPVKTSQPLKTSNINSRKPKGTSLPSPSESPSLQVTSTKPHGLVQVQRQVPQVARSLGARPKVTRPQVAGSQVTRPQLARSQVARPQPAGRRSLASSRESLDSREAGRPAVPSSTSSTRQPRRSTSTLSDNLAAERSREPLERRRGEVWRLGRGMEALAVLVGWQQGKVEEALRRSVQERRACEEVKEVLRRVKQEHRQEQAEAEALVERLGREMEDMVEQQEQEQCAREEARQQAEFTRVEEVEKKKHEEVKRMQEEAKMTARAMQASNAEKEALRGKVKQLEAKVAALVVSVMEGPGERRDAAMVQLKQEVESLTAVLDLRTREVKAAQEVREVLEAKVVDFEVTKGLVRTLRNQVEDLKAQVETTRTLERSMEAEVVRLQSSLVKESREKRNISMENEQLEWKVREGTPLACRRRQARQLENRRDQHFLARVHRRSSTDFRLLDEALLDETFEVGESSGASPTTTFDLGECTDSPSPAEAGVAKRVTQTK